MKVLIVSGCVYARNCGRFIFSGLDYVVSEIAEKVGEVSDVDIYTITPYPPNCFIGNIPIFSYSYGKLLKYLSIKDIGVIFNLIKKCGLNAKLLIKYFRAYLVSKDVELLCKAEKYDLIHINGADYSCLLVSMAGVKVNIPVLYSLHGLISNTPSISKADQVAERTILSLSQNYSFLMTCVSTGIKKYAVEEMNIPADNICVINNAVHFDEETDSDFWYDKYPQIKGKKIITYVGSIGNNKNQKQLLRAFKILPERIKRDVIILVAGNDTTGGLIDSYIAENDLADFVIVCGFLSKKEISGLFKIASLNVLLSISEGFGLSMIEAAHFGVPTLTFADLDAAKDIYNPASMMLLNDRSDVSVADGLAMMLKKKWNKEAIIRTTEKFSTDIYKGYYEVYQKIIDEGRNTIGYAQLKKVIGI